MDPHLPDDPSEPTSRPDLEPPEAAPATVPEAAPAAPRKRGLAILVAAIAVVVLGAAGAAAFIFLSGSDAKLLERIPPSAGMAGTVYLDPPAGQKVNLIRMLTEFPDVPDEAELRQELNDFLDEALADTGLTHADLDWVGSQVAFYLSIDEGLDDPRGAVLVAVDDEEGARSALETFAESAEERGETVTIEERGGFQVYLAGEEGDGAAALIDGVMVFGSGASAIDEVIATTQDGAGSLATSGIYQETMAELPDEHLASFFMNVEELTSAIEQLEILTGAGPGQLGTGGATGAGATVSAEPDGIAIDIFSGIDVSALTEEQREVLESTHEITLTELMASDTLGFFTQTGVDVTLRSAAEELRAQDPQLATELDEAGITGPGGLMEILGPDIGLVVSQGPSSGFPVDGAVMLTTTDPDAMSDLMDRWASELTAAFASDGVPTPREVTHAGVTYSVLDPSSAGVPVAYGVVDGVAVIAATQEEMNDIIDLSQGSGSSIESEPAYTGALDRVPSSDGVFFIDVEGVVAVLEEQGAPADELANLRPIVTFIVGSDSDLEGARARLFVEIP
jgi:hypothetical protein